MNADLVVIGAGPAGLCAAIEAARRGVKVLVIDENDRPGGQLFLQTHKFFGSRHHMAGVRGFHIGYDLLEEAKREGIEILLDTIVWGVFPDNRVAFTREDDRSPGIGRREKRPHRDGRRGKRRSFSKDGRSPGSWGPERRRR